MKIWRVEFCQVTSNSQPTLEFKLEKKLLGFRNMQEKLEKTIVSLGKKNLR